MLCNPAIPHLVVSSLHLGLSPDTGPKFARKKSLIVNTNVLCGSGCWIKVGRRTMLQGQKTEDVVALQFAIFCMKTDNFLSFFLTVIYTCKDLSISTSFIRFSVFWHISKSLATIAYPLLMYLLTTGEMARHVIYGISGCWYHQCCQGTRKMET